LAHLVGQAGPVSQNNYVTVLKKTNPTGYYTWQYDDAAGTIVCNDPGTQIIAYFCAGTQLSVSAARAIFTNSQRQNSRFAVVNNCPYDIWLQMKPVPAPANLCQGSFSINDGSDCLEKVASGASYVFNTPSAGLQSFNIWSKTGCDNTGYNCSTGEIGKNNGTIRSLGAQPDIETKVEATFGCTESDTSQCQQTAKGSALISSSFYDISFVDGYTRPVQLQMLRAGKDRNNLSCVTPAAPQIDLSNCPSAADLSIRP
jgi:hypothetical protein